MAKFFNYFPKTFYTNDNKPKGLDTVTNIISRFAFEQSLKENSAAFYRYDIQDIDTPVDWQLAELKYKLLHHVSN